MNTPTSARPHVVRRLLPYILVVNVLNATVSGVRLALGHGSDTAFVISVLGVGACALVYFLIVGTEATDRWTREEQQGRAAATAEARTDVGP